ncbi:MAG: hypothetical protein J5606_01560 [Bacteroidales bacterium]|nr:hypothetical protein [Bacteroidales bacterium]
MIIFAPLHFSLLPDDGRKEIIELKQQHKEIEEMKTNRKIGRENFAESTDSCKNRSFFALKKRKCLIDSLSNIPIYYILNLT